MTSHDLRQAGEALFGSRWHAELARALDVTDRTVRRWAAGSHPIPEGAARDIAELCETRGADLVSLGAELAVEKRIRE